MINICNDAELSEQTKNFLTEMDATLENQNLDLNGHASFINSRINVNGVCDMTNLKLPVLFLNRTTVNIKFLSACCF